MNYEQVIQDAIQTGIRDSWENHASPVESLDEIRERLKGFRFQGVDRLTVFGSFAKGTNTEKSDIDLLIKCDRKFDIYLFTLELEKVLGRICDIVKLNSCLPWVRRNIESSPQEIVYAG